MKILLVVTLLAIAGCGRKKPVPVVPKVVSEELTAEINRITPLLYWCDGQASGNRPNNVDGRPNCDVGDAAAESGFLTLIGQFSNEQGMFEAMKKSFGPDDQPFRAPSYVGKDEANEFSRDQTLGFVQATIAGLPAADGISRILSYYEKTGALCPHPSDTRCTLTPGMKILSKMAAGQSVTVAERIVEAGETKLEAATVPMNYRADLVMKKIYSVIKLGKATVTHARSAKLIHEKAPNNLWFSTVYYISNKGTQADFENIARGLVDCMKTWASPGSDWTWSEGDTKCVGYPPGVYGHELVALGHLLLNVQAVPITEDDTQQVNVFLDNKPVSILPELSE